MTRQDLSSALLIRVFRICLMPGSRGRRPPIRCSGMSSMRPTIRRPRSVGIRCSSELSYRSALALRDEPEEQAPFVTVGPTGV